jgi:hypothetical protein
MALGKCGRKKCMNDAEGGKELFDEEGRRYKSCRDCDNDEFPEEELEKAAQLECDECGGEGVIEVDNRSSCRRPPSDCCGGCYDSEPCPKCGEEAPEPDWDAIREEREEAAIDRNAEVEWDAPY